MRGLFVLIACALGGCAASTASGPAWPKAAAADHDGGQSLAPQESRQVAIVVEKSEEPKPAAAAEAKPAAAAAVVPEVGGIGGAVVPPPIDETIMTEDITIEIDD